MSEKHLTTNIINSEKLEVYDLDSNLISVENRKEFYEGIKEEFEKTGKITKKVRTVMILLMTSKGGIYLQKRSKIKTENAGRYDKTVGGHVSAGDTFDMTVIRECAEELGFPAAVLSPEDFEKALKVTNLDIISIFRRIEYKSDLKSVRILEGNKKMIQPLMTTMYYGYYDGPLKFVDGESSGIEVFSLDELKEDLISTPDKFTEDIKSMINEYEKLLVPIK